MNEMTSEMESLKSRLKANWMAGDNGHFAKDLEPGALEFLSRISIEPGIRVLDLACGAGQISIPAARAGAKVTGIDIATNSIEQAGAGAGMIGAGIGGLVADALNRLQPGMGYFAIFTCYAVLFLGSAIILVRVRGEETSGVEIRQPV